MLTDGERIRKIMEVAGVSTQTQMARQMGVAVGNLNGIMRGTRPMGKSTREKLFRAFGVNPQWWEDTEGAVEPVLTPPKQKQTRRRRKSEEEEQGTPAEQPVQETGPVRTEADWARLETENRMLREELERWRELVLARRSQ